MYNVKGPSKIVAKSTRRGLSQNLENLRDHSKSKSVDSNENEIINVPKPFFQSRRAVPSGQKLQDVITPQHEELIQYINDSWLSVCEEAKQTKISSNRNRNIKNDCCKFYEEDPSPSLQNFKPFDLEAWWGKRLFTYITNSVNSNN